MRIRLILALAVALLTAMVISAQSDDQGNTNDPNDNERANACYDGGTLEGKCDSEIMWQAGWYLIRYEAGLLDRDAIPSWVNWVLPPEIAPLPVAVIVTDDGETVIQAPMTNGCFTNGSNSFIFDGANLYQARPSYVQYDNRNCDTAIGIVTLTPPAVTAFEWGMVAGTNATDALTNCQNTFMSNGSQTVSNHNVISVSGLGYNTPSTWYFCEFDTGPVL